MTTPYTLPANIFKLYCDDKTAGDWHTAQQNYYAGFAAGAASRDAEIESLRADAARKDDKIAGLLAAAEALTP